MRIVNIPIFLIFNFFFLPSAQLSLRITLQTIFVIHYLSCFHHTPFGTKQLYIPHTNAGLSNFKYCRTLYTNTHRLTFNCQLYSHIRSSFSDFPNKIPPLLYAQHTNYIQGISKTRRRDTFAFGKQFASIRRERHILQCGEI